MISSLIIFASSRDIIRLDSICSLQLDPLSSSFASARCPGPARHAAAEIHIRRHSDWINSRNRTTIGRFETSRRIEGECTMTRVYNSEAGNAHGGVDSAAENSRKYRTNSGIQWGDRNVHTKKSMGPGCRSEKGDRRHRETALCIASQSNISRGKRHATSGLPIGCIRSTGIVYSYLPMISKNARG